MINSLLSEIPNEELRKKIEKHIRELEREVRDLELELTSMTEPRRKVQKRFDDDTSYRR